MVDAGSSRCEACKHKHAAYERKYRAKRDKGAQICNQCGAGHTETTKLCATCKKRNLASQYKRNFGGHRNAVFERDGNACVVCGATSKLIVHHVNGNKVNNSMENLVVVCRRCHLDIHRLGGNDTRTLASKLVMHPRGSGTNVRGRAKMAGWTPTRKTVLERAGNLCALCGATCEKLIVHHKDDRGLFADCPNNALDNLIALCKSCHNAITNQRNNGNAQLAARYIILLGHGAQGTPV